MKIQWRKAIHAQTMQQYYVSTKSDDYCSLKDGFLAMPGVHYAHEYLPVPDHPEALDPEEVMEVFVFEESAPAAQRHLFEEMPTWDQWWEFAFARKGETAQQ